MKPLGCTAARRRLHAFHDEELSVSEQIAVSAHLEWCDACAAALAELRTLASLVRSTTRERAMCLDDDGQSFQHSVVSRFKAEEVTSVTARLQDMFADMRLVYAGLCASVGALACIMLMLNMMRFVKEDQRPDSLAALVSTLASAETNQIAASKAMPANAVPAMVAAKLVESHSGGGAFAAESDNDFAFVPADAEYALSWVITREGRVEGLEVVHTSTGQSISPNERQYFRKLMRAVTRARYEPARMNGLPVAVNKVWPVAAITVHASKASDDQPAPPDAKGRVTSSHPADTSLPV